MMTKVNAVIGAAFLIGLLSVGTTSVLGQLEDQHDVKFIVGALQSPIPSDVVAQARAIDDQIMSKGEVQGQKVYLVTDKRAQALNSLVRRLLSAMGQEEREWVVRVLDTQPPTINAFVFGGKYIYVYTGLLTEATSYDELAVVLGHELGHSLLKHNLRRQQDTTNTLAGVAEIIGALAGGKKGYEQVSGVTKALRASYSRTDEEEADALGVAIAKRAGFDPLRGADFFSRMARRASDEQAKVKQQFSQLRGVTEQALAQCQRTRNQTICNNAEQKRLYFNQQVTQYQSGLRAQQIYADHPSDQNRIAAIAALTDYVNGRRDLNSLQRFQQSYRVMTALKQTDSVLLKGSEGKVEPESLQAEKAKEKHQLPGDPPWLDRQRIFNESQVGQQIQHELKMLVAERQKQLDASVEKLKAMKGKADEATYKEEYSQYKNQVEKFNAELKTKRKSLSAEFDNTVTQTLSKLNKQQMLSSDPNRAIIEVIDGGLERKAGLPEVSTEQPTKTENSMSEQLKQLKQTRDQGLITEEEYQSKRKQILERF